MITDADVKKFKGVFATKDDVKSIVDGAVKPLTHRIDKLDKKLDTAISYFDNVTSQHVKRLNRLEKHTNLSPIVD